MTRETMPSIIRIDPPELGAPPGYSQIVEETPDRIVFIAGQTALDRDGNVVGRNDFAVQAERDRSHRGGVSVIRRTPVTSSSCPAAPCRG
jgi:enamine deaminase RidA (YjgF/YER057c/UK114 family)